jgi:hypothetical protein
MATPALCMPVNVEAHLQGYEDRLADEGQPGKLVIGIGQRY